MVNIDQSSGSLPGDLAKTMDHQGDPLNIQDRCCAFLVLILPPEQLWPAHEQSTRHAAIDSTVCLWPARGEIVAGGVARSSQELPLVDLVFSCEGSCMTQSPRPSGGHHLFLCREGECHEIPQPSNLHFAIDWATIAFDIGAHERTSSERLDACRKQFMPCRSSHLAPCPASDRKHSHSAFWREVRI